MKTLGIVPVVEGHGEQGAVRILLTRTIQELLGGPLTAAMDLAMCRAASPSFDKLCRELAVRLAPA